jgi:predicted CoA-binding protein
LSDVPDEIDIVEVFRPSDDVPNYVDDIIEKKPKVLWLQLGIHNQQAEEKVAAQGIKVISDKCMRVEVRRKEIS